MIQKPKFWLIVSLVVIFVCIVVIVVLRPVWGIDFLGGSLLVVSTEGVPAEDVRMIIDQELGLVATVQSGEGNDLLIKSAPLDEETHQQLLSLLRRENLIKEELRFESIGPTIGAELRRKALLAVVIVVAVLIAYLAYTFRQASGIISSWKFGIAAVYALLHDLLVVMAIFVILGRVMDVSIDTLFVTAMLAILGYSVNDSIVIFNRMKSEWVANRSASLIEVLDTAVKKSIVRSLNTSFTTLLVLGALLLFGGSTIRWFVVALAAGTVVGTYSSLFVAPPALYFLSKR